jgi:hypothetical protein
MRLVFKRCHGENPAALAVGEGDEPDEFFESFITEKELLHLQALQKQLEGQRAGISQNPPCEAH